MTNTITQGVISCDEKGLFPCIFIGTYLKSGVEIGTNLKPGQFIFDHQYGGLKCQHHQLFGIVLPIATCSDQSIVEGLNKIVAIDYLDPYPFSDEPTLDDLVRVQRDLQAVGPLDCSQNFRELDEAFITFDPRKAYEWLKQNFKMVASIEEPSHRWGYATIASTAEILWSWEDFVSWLAGNWYVAEVLGVLLCENSD